jgi:hypothetical protein
MNSDTVMSSTKQITGMRGVYLVAAEMSRHGFIASPISRSAHGADILYTDAECKKAFSVQVKTKSTKASYWLLSSNYKRFVSDSHIYVFVSIKESGVPAEFFIIPSRVVAKKAYSKPFGKDIWYWFEVDDAKPYQDRWEIFRGSSWHQLRATANGLRCPAKRRPADD